MPRDVLEHDDRVVDDETDTQRQRHQRKVVEAVAEHVHQRERADDRQRQREARNDRRRRASQEREDHAHDEPEREQESYLHVMYRGSDRLRAIVKDREVDRRWELGFECGQNLAHCVDDLDGIGSRLALNGEHDAASPVVPGCDLVVLHAVEHTTKLLETHRRAVAVRDDQRPVGDRVGELPRRLNIGRLVAAIERSGRQVDIGVADRLLDVGQRDPARGE